VQPVSDKNPLLKQIRRAVSQGTLTDGGYCVIESAHLLDEARAANCEIGALLVSQSAWTKSGDDLAGARLISDKIFQQLSSTESPQGILALVRPPSYSLDQIFDLNIPSLHPPSLNLPSLNLPSLNLPSLNLRSRAQSLIVILDGVQDPGNAGAILRAAEAFGATGAVFLKGTVNPYNPKCLRGSAGSVFRLPLAAGIEESALMTAFSSAKLNLYAAMPRAEQLLSDADLLSPSAIVIGSEGRGVSPALAARATALRIPTQGVESLNAAVAAGIFLYESRRQRSASIQRT
jgi:RNA methyltransferase, TrmH family